MSVMSAPGLPSKPHNGVSKSLGGFGRMCSKERSDDSDPFEPGSECGERMDQQQYLKTSRVACQRIFEGATVAMGLEITEGPLDLHALGVDRHDLTADSSASETGVAVHQI